MLYFGKITVFGTVTFGGLVTQNAIAPTPFNPEQDVVRDAYFVIMKTHYRFVLESGPESTGVAAASCCAAA